MLFGRIRVCQNDPIEKCEQFLLICKVCQLEVWTQWPNSRCVVNSGSFGKWSKIEKCEQLFSRYIYKTLPAKVPPSQPCGDDPRLQLFRFFPNDYRTFEDLRAVNPEDVDEILRNDPATRTLGSVVLRPCLNDASLKQFNSARFCKHGLAYYQITLK